jgi:hypothetical protein
MLDHRRLIMLALLMLSLFSCDEKQEGYKDTWFEKAKKEIFRQSSYLADSISISYNDDSSFARKCYFFQGRKLRLRGYSRGHLALETSYSKDGDFEFRREICKNGHYSFEGIVYKNEFYGLSTWYHCSVKSQPQSQGVRFKSERIGVWKKWDEKGDLIGEVDYGKRELLDSLPQIEGTYN